MLVGIPVRLREAYRAAGSRTPNKIVGHVGSTLAMIELRNWSIGAEGQLSSKSLCPQADGLFYLADACSVDTTDLIMLF